MPFLETLRDLDAKATPGPFLWDEPDNWCGLSARVATSKYEPVAQVVISGWPRNRGQDTAALLVLLRNSAARLAAVVEAAGAVIDYANRLELDPEDRAIVDPLRAALTALNKEAP